MPVFLIGAATGRLWGEALHVCLGPAAAASLPPAGVLAVLGGAGLVAGVTRTLSTILVVLEMSGQARAPATDTARASTPPLSSHTCLCPSVSPAMCFTPSSCRLASC